MADLENMLSGTGKNLRVCRSESAHETQTFSCAGLHSSSSPSESHLYNLNQNSYNKITLAIRAGYRRNGGNYVRAVEKRCI